MRPLRVTGLAITLSLVHAPAIADIRALNDSVMSEVTGQSGVTIELQSRIDVDRISWTDEGTIGIDNLTLSDPDGSPLDNLKATIDIAGDGEVLTHGFSELARRGGQGLIDANDPDVADVISRYDQGGTYGRQYGSGDVAIHIGPTDSGDVTSIDDYLNAVDFGLTIDGINTNGSEGSASMFSDINLQGNIGPTDLVITNNGNGTRTLANGTQVGESELQFSTHFDVDQGSLNWDAADVILLFNFAGVRIEGMQIHNRRGQDTTGHFGMAYAQANVARGISAATGKEGLSLHDVEFRADIDMPTFKIGGTSIGSVQFTDFVIKNTNAVVYGHQ
ncbi:hypothetical protein C8D92_10650 [Tamilnaduibacter salinus]|uniref:DUF6160 domain-containing protein n=1 Tax=Tamilnaduibacter salinus TaxID=1484056 RepID=A0A2U1CVQ4_9GAMM|nr:DUF6160 family protein [Tamilnaduibacter salinus]PVY75790.1 hypothetical protein C8D92_10650 [Tamilnaduibacter salinus]